MRATQENHGSKSQLAHVEKEQVDIKADIKIIQHDIVAIKEAMATKADVALLKAELKGDISDLRTELKSDISSVRSEISDLKSSLIKWNVSLFIAGLTINLAALGVIVAFLAKQQGF